MFLVRVFLRLLHRQSMLLLKMIMTTYTMPRLYKLIHILLLIHLLRELQLPRPRL
jgi:hypothetical protein